MKAVIARKVHCYQEIAQATPPAYLGTQALIRSLASYYPLALASSSRQAEVDTILQALGLVGQLACSPPLAQAAPDRVSGRRVQAPEPPTPWPLWRARARRAWHLPPQMNGLGSRFQPRAAASNQAMISCGVVGCWPYSTHSHHGACRAA